MKNSKLFSLNWYDLLKGLVVAILTPIIVFAQNYFANGTLDVEIKSLLAVGLSGLLAYLIKNFFTDAPVNNEITKDVKSYVGNRPNDR